MDRAELLHELDRIIDVGIVNAKHDSDVLRHVRKLLTGPVYVVTSGCYSDYCIKCVTMDKNLAENLSKIVYDGNDVEEYIPVETSVSKEKFSKDDSFEVTWNPEQNQIIRLEYSPNFYVKNARMCYGGFDFWIPNSKRVFDDVLANGKNSELIKKIAQDEYAKWKYENEIIYVCGIATTQKNLDEQTKEINGGEQHDTE